jgi:menaquinone-dependent protoporphyrinogen oxidase
MKTLILYTTKHGATRDLAQRMADKMGGADIHDLKQGKPPRIADYDCVIVGGSLYVGALPREAKDFLAQNKDALLGKKLGLFLCGLQPEEAEANVTNNFPAELRNAAKATAFLGGVYDPGQAGVMERLAMKAVAKISEYTDRLDEKAVDAFVEKLKA